MVTSLRNVESCIGVHVVLSELKKGEDPVKVNLDFCDLYVQASGLSLTLLHERMAVILGNAMGNFVEMEDSSRKH